jgi:hypothetical protein
MFGAGSFVGFVELSIFSGFVDFCGEGMGRKVRTFIDN